MRNVCKKKSVATVKSIKNQSLSSADDHPSSLFCHLAPAVGCSCTGCTAADPTHTPSHPAPRLRPRPAAYATYRTAHVGPKCRAPLPPPAPPLLRSPRPRAAQPRSPQGLAPLCSARLLLLVQPVRHVVAELSPLVALLELATWPRRDPRDDRSHAGRALHRGTCATETAAARARLSDGRSTCATDGRGMCATDGRGTCGRAPD